MNFLKIIKPFDNLKRHILSGQAPQALIHAKLEIDIRANSILIRFRSLTDNSILKEIEINAINGDTILLNGVVASYKIIIENNGA